MKKSTLLYVAVVLIAAIGLMSMSCSNPAAEEIGAVPATSDLYVTDAIIATVSNILGGYITENGTLSIDPDLPADLSDPAVHVGNEYTLIATDLDLSGAIINGTVTVSVDSFSSGILEISAGISSGLTIDYDGDSWEVYSSGMQLRINAAKLTEATSGSGNISINGTSFSMSTMVANLITRWY